MNENRVQVSRRAVRPREQGGTMVEFAIVASLFLLVLMAIIDLGLLFWVNLTMQYAVREGVRYAITGQANLDPNGGNQQRYLAVIQSMKDNSMGMWPSLAPVVSIGLNGGAAQSYANQASYTSGMFGSAGDIVVVQVNCTWPLLTPLMAPFFPGGKYNFSVAGTMRNEAF